MDHYTTLGVAKNATPDEIKKAYRKLASKHHPDKGGDTSMFQKIEEAYRILSDPEKKAHYDNPNSHGLPPNFGDMFTGEFDARDIFSHIFSQRSGNPFQNKSSRQIFRTQMSVSLEDVYNGATHVLKLQTPMGLKMMNIDIPKGLPDGSHLRFDNVLDNNTSLIVEFKVMPNLRFERRGNDLYCNQKISVLDLIVGTKINFQTISGKTFEVSVPPKTQPYIQLKITGQGMPIPNSNLYGDQILLLKPFMPDTIANEITESILRSRTN
jgi:DnaJ-class molecular chaperone